MQAAGLLPVQAQLDAIQQTGTVGVAAAGRVDNLFCLNARNLDQFTAGKICDPSPPRVTIGASTLSAMRQTGALLQHFGFVNRYDVTKSARSDKLQQARRR